MSVFKRLSWVVLFATWLLPCVPASVSALTLSQIRDEIRRNTRDTSSSSSLRRYSDTILNSFINEAQRITVNLTWCLQETTGYALTSGSTFYSLPSNYIAAMQVTFTEQNGMTRYLEEISKKSLAQSNPDFMRQGGKPINYFTQYSTASGTSLEIAYIPIPNNSSSTGVARVDYYALADDLSSDSDIPFNGLVQLYPFHNTIVNKVSARISLIEGRGTEATLYEQMFQGELAILQAKFNQLPNYFPSVGATGSNIRSGP